jgi:hypothetical protein
MNRRTFWQSLGTALAGLFASARTGESSTSRPPPSYRFYGYSQNGSAKGVCFDVATDPMDKRQAAAFLRDSVRDMQVVMAQGKVYPKVEWPDDWEWKGWP